MEAVSVFWLDKSKGLAPSCVLIPLGQPTERGDMKVATLKTADGSEQILSLSNGAFILGQNPITKEQVVEYDNLGVLSWESNELRELALKSPIPQESPQQSDISDHAVVAIGTIGDSKSTLSTKDGILYLDGNALSEDAVTGTLIAGSSWKWKNGWDKHLATSQFGTVVSEIGDSKSSSSSLINGFINGNDSSGWVYLGNVMFAVWILSSLGFAVWYFSVTANLAWILGLAIIPVTSIFIGLWTFIPLLLLRTLVDYQLNKLGEM